MMFYSVALKLSLIVLPSPEQHVSLLDVPSPHDNDSTVPFANYLTGVPLTVCPHPCQ